VSSSLNSDAAAVPTKSGKSNFLQITLTTFVTVFLAELGDKTQVTTLMFTAQSRSPVVVFFGAAIALVLSSLIGVIAGRWLAKNFSPQLLDTLAGLSFMCLAIGLLWDAVKG
jgi:Ca2+/H+ antiporter, TMEM165/GDT1 family